MLNDDLTLLREYARNHSEPAFAALVSRHVNLVYSVWYRSTPPSTSGNAVKFFSAVELIALLADREWLDETTKTIGQYWRRKNARRNGLILENAADATM